jgi:hypothetical protein
VTASDFVQIDQADEEPNPKIGSLQNPSDLTTMDMGNTRTRNYGNGLQELKLLANLEVF